MDGDWAGAETALQRAIALNPSYPELRVWHAELLGATGRTEAGLAETRRALELDPHNSTLDAWLGQHLLWAGRDDEAIAHLLQFLDRDPAAPLARGLVRTAFERKGMYERALAEARQTLLARGDHEVVEALERGYARGGYREAMRAWAELTAERSRHAYVPPTQVADLYAGAGEAELAIDWLERGYQEGESRMVYLAVAPRWDVLREHPRFQELLRRMGLPG